DDEFVPRKVPSEFRADDLAAWNFTPHRDTVDQPEKREVVNILDTAGYLVSAFFSENRLSDDLVHRGYDISGCPTVAAVYEAVKKCRNFSDRRSPLLASLPRMACTAGKQGGEEAGSERYADFL